MWRHEQLPLTFSVSDQTDLTDGNEIKYPAGNIRDVDGRLVVVGGAEHDLYCVLSLPRGYRFRGYKMVLINNRNNFKFGDNTFVAMDKTMYETDGSYNINSYKARGYYADDPDTYTMGTTNEDDREYVLERYSETDTDMSNQLYFCLHRGKDDLFGVTIKSFTVYFTAEGTFEAEIKPNSTDVARSLVMSPFKTNKIDIGAVQTRTKDNKNFYYAYSYQNVVDLDAHCYIYQENAVQDGVPSDVDSQKKIFPVTIDGKNYFAFGNGTYYAEAPTYVYTPTGLTCPIGYRVVGAKFVPQWTNETVGTHNENRTHYYISYTVRSWGTTYTYYLNDQLHFTTTSFAWSYDSETRGVYTETGGYKRYLSCEGSDDTRTLTLSSYPPSSTEGEPGYYDLVLFTRDRTNYVGWDANNYSNRWYLQGSTSASATVYVRRNVTNNAAKWSSSNEQVTLPAFAAGGYTLEVYDKTGKTVVAKSEVSASKAEPIDLSDKSYGYNNDAVKFTISGLPDGKQALVDVSLMMQALNPYIDQLELVCHDPDDQLRLSQTFTAENFMVNGRRFDFYIPAKYAESNLLFTFADLYSQYGDDSYYKGTDRESDGNARYSFVTSPYHLAFDGKTGDQTYAGIEGDEYVDTETDAGLYDKRYDPDIEYTHKVYADKVGNIRFKFNNAEDLKNTNNGVASNYLQEYPFTVSNYIGSDDPDKGSAKGEFIDCAVNAKDAEAITYYLFAADETRYNIAPSTAWQHRYYAFYRMGIDLKTSTYEPKLTWTKVYDKTCFNKNGRLAQDDMWGLKLNTVETDNPNHVVTGYLTVKQISDAIAAEIADPNISTPKSPEQILYVDGGELYSIINSTTISGNQTTTMTLETLQNSMAKNVLFYLPQDMSALLTNCAVKPTDWTAGNPYNATLGIDLTDNNPFYAPYDIIVDVDKRIVHERKITVPKNGKVTSASIIMPFDILIDGEGQHTNLDGGKFKLRQMSESNCLTTGEGKDYVYFPVLKGVTRGTHHTPYMVDVVNPPQESSISFVLSQKGGTIKATTGTEGWDYTYPGETGSGSRDGVTYTFTNHGSYSGKALAKNGNFFYYAKNMFLRSNDYVYDEDILIAPFRAYYSTTSSGVRTLSSFDLLFDDADVNAVNSVSMGEMGRIDESAPVFDLQGRKLADNLRSSNLGKGIYVINGVKIIIK
mgnify:CR=1 FL=1